MLGVAIGRHPSAVDFQRSLSGLLAELVITGPGTFEATTTSITLPHMFLLRASENLPRIAHVVLPSSQAMITFSLIAEPHMCWNGVAMRPGDLIVHGLGERLHQRTGGPSSWGLLCIDRAFLRPRATAMLRRPVLSAEEGAVLRAPSRESREFVRLQERVVCFVEARPVQVGLPKVAESLEQDLLYALLCCLRDGERQPASPARSWHVAVVNRFAALLAGDLGRRLRLADLCAAIEISDRTLRLCCHEVLGMGPSAYLRLCRLSRARAAITEAPRGTLRIAEVARRFGFAEAGQFAAAYRLAFGELPSTTLARS